MGVGVLCSRARRSDAGVRPAAVAGLSQLPHAVPASIVHPGRSCRIAFPLGEVLEVVLGEVLI